MAGFILLLNIFGLIFTFMCFIARGYMADFVELKGESKPFFLLYITRWLKNHLLISLYIALTV